MHPPDDRTRLRHMLDAAEHAVAFIDQKDAKSLGEDLKLALAILKCLEIVGEAASKVSEETRNRLPDVNWKQIVRARNRLIHGYFDIDVGILWQTTRQDLPPLIASLRAYLKATDP